MKAAAEVIEQAAPGHAIERRSDHLQEQLIVRVTPSPQQPAEGQRLRELRRRPEPAELRIERSPQGRFGRLLGLIEVVGCVKRTGLSGSNPTGAFHAPYDLPRRPARATTA